MRTRLTVALIFVAALRVAGAQSPQALADAAYSKLQALIHRHRLLAAAAGFGIVVLTGAAAMFVGARTPAPAATARPPLELVTLGHDRSDTGLAVRPRVLRTDTGVPKLTQA